MAKISINNMNVTMTTPDGSSHYFLMSKAHKINCIESFDISGGVTQPFEYLNLSVSKRRLNSMAPGLVDNIIPGRTLIYIRAFVNNATSTFIVSKAKLEGSGQSRNYNIQAYALPQLYKSSVTRIPYLGNSYRPFEIISDILNDSSYGPNNIPNGMRFVGSNFKYYYTTEQKQSADGSLKVNGEWVNPNQIYFPAGTNVWRVLQICAWHLGCKLWFSGNTAYLVDFKTNAGVIGSTSPNEYNDIYLHSLSSSTASALLGNVDLGDEGVDTINNKLIVNYGKARPITGLDADSINSYGQREKTITIREFGSDTATDGTTAIPEGTGNSTGDAQYFARRLLDYRAQPQTSIKIKVKEMSIDGAQTYWEPHFEDVSRARMIQDRADEVTIYNRVLTGNESNSDDRKPEMLYLSEYKRTYPEGCTSYWWGKVDNADLTQTMSNLQN